MRGDVRVISQQGRDLVAKPLIGTARLVQKAIPFPSLAGHCLLQKKLDLFPTWVAHAAAPTSLRRPRSVPGWTASATRGDALLGIGENGPNGERNADIPYAYEVDYQDYIESSGRMYNPAHRGEILKVMYMGPLGVTSTQAEDPLG